MNTIRTNRPLVVAFLALIIGIVIWDFFQNDNSEDHWNRKRFICSGVVEDIQTTSTAKVIYLSDVSQITKDYKVSSLKKILLYDKSEQSSQKKLFSNIRIGNKIQVTGEIENFEKAGNPGQFDALAYYRSLDLDARMFVTDINIIDTSYNYLKQLLYEGRAKALENLTIAMGKRDAGLLGAMLLGDKSELDSAIKELYQQTGVAHMLAISGLHISLLGMVLFDWLRKNLIPMKAAVIVSLILLLLYGQFTGFSIATSRAVWMLCIHLVARYVGRPYDGFTALAISGSVILLQNPNQLFECSFVLSFVAAGGILAYQEMTKKRQKKMKEWQNTICVTIWTFLLTLPVMFWFFYEVCIYSIVANLIILPFLALLLGIGIFGCLLCFISPFAGGFLLASAHWILVFYESICRIIQKLPGSTWVMGRPDLWKIIVYYIVLFLNLYYWGMKKNYIKCFLGVVVLSAMLIFFRPHFEFIYIQMDVGQGDCACIFNRDKTYLIDGGSTSEKEIGKYRIEKMLKYYGRDEIQAIFVTHGDEDHVNAVEELIRRKEKNGLKIDKIILPQLQKKEDGLQEFIEKIGKYDTTINFMQKGQSFCAGKLRMNCLYPASENEWKDANDCSLTFDLTYRDLSILTTGDLGVEGEENIVLPRKKYDILKVGHHGSKNSSSESFLQKVGPQYGFISVGENNRYGHPAKETLQRLESISCKNWSTAKKGALFVQYEKGLKRCWYFKR